MSSLIENPPPGAPVPPILPPQDGYLFLDRTNFQASFAADVSADAAAFMADSQVPWGLDALSGAVTGLRGRRSQAETHRPRRQDDSAGRATRHVRARRLIVVEVKGSHAVYVSQPRAVADIIAKAANGVALATQ